jgi:thiamine biosynthesis protein ThiC
VNPEHLFLGEAQDNSTDMVRKRRQARWEGCFQAKLSREQVAEIRASSLPARVFAQSFGVTPSAVRYARRGATWKGAA